MSHMSGARMTDCRTSDQMVFPFYKDKPLTVNFRGGDISSDGGMLLVRQLDQRERIVDRIAETLVDRRDQRYIDHEMLTLLRQRIYQIVAGYEDCNDATTLRHDPIFKLCCDRSLADGDDLASQPTLSRLENDVRPRDLVDLSELLLELYISRFKRPPKYIILDADSTDDPTHGNQQLSLFHGYYDQHMYHPLLLFDGERGDLLAALLRPGNVASFSDLMPVLKRVIFRLRHKWKHVRIIVRADAGFANPELYDFCEAEHLDYIIGFKSTQRLKTLNKKNVERAQRRFQASGIKVRHLTSTPYKAGKWPKHRRMLMKTEVTKDGVNERFVVTNLPGRALERYDFYVGRGQVENQMIKELKLDLKADRLSCHRFVANQFRLFLHSFAYVLVHRLRLNLGRTEWAAARVDSLRLKLIKVGARVTVSCRRVWVMLASGYPYRQLYYTLFNRLALAPSDA